MGGGWTGMHDIPDVQRTICVRTVDGDKKYEDSRPGMIYQLELSANDIVILTKRSRIIPGFFCNRREYDVIDREYIPIDSVIGYKIKKGRMRFGDPRSFDDKQFFVKYKYLDVNGVERIGFKQASSLPDRDETKRHGESSEIDTEKESRQRKMEGVSEFMKSRAEERLREIEKLCTEHPTPDIAQEVFEEYDIRGLQPDTCHVSGDYLFEYKSFLGGRAHVGVYGLRTEITEGKLWATNGRERISQQKKCVDVFLDARVKKDGRSIESFSFSGSAYPINVVPTEDGLRVDMHEWEEVLLDALNQFD